MDLTPLHDAIIFNDLADIINDLENNLNPESYNNIYSSGEDSSEDIEDLLSEYNQYLDKVHKQTLNYISKSKGKNKVPSLHREKYTKRKPSKRNQYDASNNFLNSVKYVQPSFSDPINLFMAHNAKLNMFNKPGFADQPQYFKDSVYHIPTQTADDTALLNLVPTTQNLNNPMSCFCKVNQKSCKCGCKQCFMLADSLPNRNHAFIEYFPKATKYGLQNKMKNGQDGKINIRIKIDVQLPKILSDIVGKIKNNKKQEKTAEKEVMLSKEMTSDINLPFPVLIDFLGNKKNYNKHENSVHKITIRKKKKQRFNNNTKKLTGNKFVTFYSGKQDLPLEYIKTDENSSFNRNNSEYSTQFLTDVEEPNFHTNKSLNDEMVSNSTTTTDLPSKYVVDSNKTTNLITNIKKSDNYTNESIKIGNSIETDYVLRDNKTTVEPLRLKREILHTNISVTYTTPPKHNNSSDIYKKGIKRNNTTNLTSNSISLAINEMELLYWPMESKNVTLLKPKNITAMILERETSKAKMNMTNDKIRSNPMMALEQAVFGDVDWNDVDTIVPVFISFVGKYIRGILTFCSQNVCHSIKCGEKNCFHRVCTPDNRFNQKGHCTGNINTDSIAAMESVMDLPSNIGFEIVDILKDKMLGKIYGKATLCIMSKCNTLVVSKKIFQRTKCINKELNSSGHCPIAKRVKIT